MEQLVFKYAKQGNWLGGNSQSLYGIMIRDHNDEVFDDIHKEGTEIVGGYLLLQASSLDKAIEIPREFPV